MQQDVFFRVMRVLSDPQRFEILERIAAARPLELPCKELAQTLPVSQATISHHLKELSGAGLIEGRRDGQCMYFRFLPEVMKEYQAELSQRMKAKG